jgi:UDP-sugar transporter A1/2/3
LLGTTRAAARRRRGGQIHPTPPVQILNMSATFKDLFSLKYGALALLVLQNTFLVVFMRYSRQNSGPLYASSTAVAVMELVKFVTCVLVVAHEKRTVAGFASAIREELLQHPMEIVKLSVPSLLYTVQNNLLYYALSHLDAATFQVGYQVKILTTAVFSVLMLGKRISAAQWGSLVVLTVGVSLAQLSAQERAAAHHNTTMGFVAVLAAACTSGFSGVYFERILKNSGTSLWMRNIQMGVSSIVLGFAGVFLSGDRAQVLDRGFFFGYNGVVVAVILLQAIGGLVVAVVVKYADNILKGFAASFSIVTSCVLCYFFFDFRPNLLFLVGAVRFFCFCTFVSCSRPSLFFCLSCYLVPGTGQRFHVHVLVRADGQGGGGGVCASGGCGCQWVPNAQTAPATSLTVVIRLQDSCFIRGYHCILTISTEKRKGKTIMYIVDRPSIFYRTFFPLLPLPLLLLPRVAGLSLAVVATFVAFATAGAWVRHTASQPRT